MSNPNVTYQWCHNCEEVTPQLVGARSKWSSLAVCQICRRQNRTDFKPYTRKDLWPNYDEFNPPGYGDFTAEEEMAEEEWLLAETVDGFQRYMSGSWWSLYGE